MSDTPEQRDKIIARLAAAALRSGAEIHSACPDAEVIAAYADRSLNAAEVEKWEAHFAACTQCRHVLALLATSTGDSIASGLASEPALEPAPEDVQQIEQLVAAAASPSTAPTSIQSAARPPRRSKLWLAPLVGVMGAAAALVLWLALRPAAPPTQTVAEIPPSAAPAAPGPSSPAVNSAPPNPSSATAQTSNSQSSGSEIAQTGIPAPPAAASTAAKRSEPAPAAGRELDQAKQETPAKEPQKVDAVAAPAPAPPENAAVAGSGGASASAEARAAAPAAPGSTDEAITELNTAHRSEVPRLETQKNTPSAAPSPGAASANQPAAQAAGRPAVLAGTASALSNGTVAGLAKTTNPGTTFAAPGGRLWRVGPAGRIERSGDKGATWQPQSSGVTSDLLAGVAVSGQVAWAVGRAGIILRTTDGETWQRVPPPNGLMLDWTRIKAADALHISITSSDGRGFRTENGGNTWTPQ